MLLKNGLMVKFFDNLIWNLLNCSLLVDTINGFFINSGRHLPISVLFKSLLFLILLQKLFSFKKGIYCIMLTFFYISFLIFFFGTTIRSDLFSNTITLLLKFLYVVWLYIYSAHYVSTNLDGFSRIITFFKINGLVFFVNIFLGGLGFGYSMYGTSEVGTKGFFFAGNELSSVFLIIFPVLLYYVAYQERHLSLRYWILSFIFFTLSLWMTTKVSILGCILTLIVIPLLSYRESKILLKIIFFTSVFIVLLFSITDKILSEAPMLERWTFFYEKNGLWFLLSGRESYFSDVLQEYLSSGFFHILFGIGESRIHSVEMDLFDTLFNYGIIGFLIVYSFYFSFILKSFLLKKNPFREIVLFVNLLLFFVAFISGHTYFSATAGVFIAILNSILSITINKQMKIESQNLYV